MDALDKANIQPEFIEKVKGYLNNPMYSIFLPMLGINKKVALEKLESLEQMMSNKQACASNDFNKSSSFQGSQKNDDLERFRKGLNSFK